jgi:hypothetical protein
VKTSRVESGMICMRSTVPFVAMWSETERGEEIEQKVTWEKSERGHRPFHFLVRSRQYQPRNAANQTAVSVRGTFKRSDLIATELFNPKTQAEVNRRPADFFSNVAVPQITHLDPAPARSESVLLVQNLGVTRKNPINRLHFAGFATSREYSLTSLRSLNGLIYKHFKDQSNVRGAIARRPSALHWCD